jgi:hypothetical protein
MANYDIFDENYYLAKYPFVQESIDRGIIIRTKVRTTNRFYRSHPMPPTLLSELP